jgi:hypothetical protein
LAPSGKSAADQAAILNSVSMLQGDPDLDPSSLVESLTQSLLENNQLLQQNLLETSTTATQLQTGTTTAPSTSFSLQHAIQQQQAANLVGLKNQ